MPGLGESQHEHTKVPYPLAFAVFSSRTHPPNPMRNLNPRPGILSDGCRPSAQMPYLPAAFPQPTPDLSPFGPEQHVSFYSALLLILPPLHLLLLCRPSPAGGGKDASSWRQRGVYECDAGLRKHDPASTWRMGSSASRGRTRWGLAWLPACACHWGCMHGPGLQGHKQELV